MVLLNALDYNQLRVWWAVSVCLRAVVWTQKDNFLRRGAVGGGHGIGKTIKISRRVNKSSEKWNFDAGHDAIIS